jgi:hypothetical protein
LQDLKDEKAAIEEKEKLTRKDQIRLRQIEAEMKPLEQFLADAKLQRQAIKSEIGTRSNGSDQSSFVTSLLTR